MSNPSTTSNGGYELHAEVMIQRSKHRVYFGTGTRADSLACSLSYVPKDAGVDEVIVNSDGSGYIEFHHEQLVSQ